MRERERERESEKEIGIKNRRQEFSVFVLNIPRLLDRYGLYGIFKKAGTISDTYIPNRSYRKDSKRFGFVRFTNAEDARRCIQLFHRARVRGHTLIVTKAKPRKRKQQENPRIQGWINNLKGTENMQRKIRRMEWRSINKNQANQGQMAVFIDEEQDTGFSLKGKLSTENEEWLCRSLVCLVEEPRDLATLSSALLYDYDPDVRVSALSSLRFLLTFPTVERMEVALQQQEALAQWFSEIKKWGIEDSCDSRRAWLNIVGVPPHGWMWENFKMIAELWGKFICLGKSASSKDSFEAMRVCIATNTFQKINSEIVLSLGTCGYRIFITEMDMVTQVQVHNVHNPATNFKEKDDIPGFEDVADSNEGEDDNLNNDLQGQAEQEDEEVLSNSNSKMLKGQQSLRSNDNSNWSPSKTRTKTASLSNNGYSEEMCKVRKLLSAKAAGVINAESSIDSQPPPGFEYTSQQHMSCNHIVDKSPIPDKIVEDSCCLDQNLAQERNEVQTLVDQVDTASKGNFRIAKTLQQAATSSNSSDSTSESLKQLAQESLKVGEILGVKVIGSYEAAIARITKPLKKARGQKKCSTIPANQKY